MCRALSQPEVRKEHYGATRIKPREGEKWKQWKECYKWCIFDKKQAWTNLLNMRLQQNNWCRRIWCVQFCTTDAGLEMQAYNCRFRCFNKRTFLVILQLMSLRQFLISATLLRSRGGGYLRVICIAMKGDIVKPIWLKRGKIKVTPAANRRWC